MVFTVGDEFFNHNYDTCFRVVKVNRRSVNLEIYHFTDDNGITEVSYKNYIRLHENAESISFNYNGNRYRFSSQEGRNYIY
jgi:hypothetical protein